MFARVGTEGLTTLSKFCAKVSLRVFWITWTPRVKKFVKYVTLYLVVLE